MGVNIVDGLSYEEPADPLETRTLGQYIEMRQRQERKPFQPHWDNAVSLLRSNRWPTMQDFAAHYCKAPRWATEFKAVAIRQRLFTVDDWRGCLKRDTRNGRPIEDPCQPEGSQSRPEVRGDSESAPSATLEDEEIGTSPDGYVETADILLERLRRHEFASVKSVARFYRKPLSRIEIALNKLCDSAGISPEQLQGYFKRRTRKRPLVDREESHVWETTACDTTATPSH